jgi:ribonuclease Z
MSNLHTLESCPKWQMSNGYTLQGRSVAGDRTGFKIKELDMILDAGIMTKSNPKIILMTHTHTDHAFALPTIIEGNTNPAIVIMPREAEEAVRGFLDSYRNLVTCSGIEANAKQMKDLNLIQYAALGSNESFAYTHKNKHITINVLSLTHRVPTNGYVISEIRDKLLPKYKGLPGKEIGKLKKGGVQITQSTIVPLFAYITDTSIDGVIDNYDTIMKSPVVIIECTFLDKETADKRKYTKHICWNELEPIVRANSKTTFILIHISNRYSYDEIFNHFNATKLHNIVVWHDDRVIDDFLQS